MVGVSLHFGPVATLPYWLRAHGIVLTSVRTPAIDSLQGLTNYQFSLSPPADVPVFLSTSEIGLSPRLSSIRKILGATGRLGMLVDVDAGNNFMSGSRSLVPDGDRPDQIGADVTRRAGSGSNRRNLHVEVYRSFRKPGTATLPW